ncbi:MAG: FtsX-like permease family protein [Chitinivibrionales bacterium]|nr:FtsX-like permease family protein [Chitinivibrionales bacterium]
MPVIVLISLRNLLRQKRRNILLGIAMAFGTMILVLANSFSHGISDVLFNKIVAYVAGHVNISFTEGSNLYKQVFRDGDRIVELVKKELPDITQIQEAIGVLTRAIGNGKADNVIMVGVDLDRAMGIAISKEELKKEQEEYKQNFKMVDGDFLDLAKSGAENPVAVSESKAKYLNVKKGDIIRVRFTDIDGQSQAARLTVVAIFKPANSFMAAPVFLEVQTLKRLLGYGPHDIAQLYLRIKNAKKMAAKDADRLHAVLEPSTAVIFGKADVHNKSAMVSVLGLRADTAAKKILMKNFAIVLGDSVAAFGKEGVCMVESLAAALGVMPGDTCTVTYKAKYDTQMVSMKYPIKAIVKPLNAMRGNVVFVNEKEFYAGYYYHWPQDARAHYPGAYLPAKSDVYYAAFDPEWMLLKRSRTTDDATKQVRELGKSKFKGVAVNVQSMYESASAVLQLEGALNMITFSAVMVLFFIILIGVINTLRMTIRERTREIGTVRAIGMQKNDVRNSFLLETFFLALFASLTGVVLAFALIGIFSLVPINMQDNPMSMLLVNNHLNFKPAAVDIIFDILLILAISVGTAYFPARRAAKLSAAAALRHYE